MPSPTAARSSSEADNGHSKEPEVFRASVLIIDDEPAFCFAITEILRIAGHQVREAHSVHQAMEMLAADPPDLILTDIMMPGLDGLSFLRKLRNIPELSSVPTIAISAKARKEDKEGALQAGADAYLAKPFSAQELHEAINPFLISMDGH